MPLIPSPIVDVNGLFLSRTSCDLIADTQRLRLFKSMHWTKKLTPGKTWGNRALPRGRGRGKFEPSADLELYYEDYVLLRNYLAVKGLAVGYMATSFTLTLTAFEPTLGVTTAVLFGCRITEDDVSVGDGDDQLSVKLTLDVMNIIADGVIAVRENTPLGI